MRCLLILSVAFATLAVVCAQHEIDVNNAFVLTPFGYWPTECVHHAPDGSRLVPADNYLIVEHADGTSTKFPPCSRMNMTQFALQRKTKQRFGVSAPNQNYPNGWAAYAEDQLTTNCASFDGQWPVPPTPASSDNQTVFLFTGLQNAFFFTDAAGVLQADVTIIQPVLQWGPSAAGGGNYWAIASWFVGSGGELQYSTPAQVNTGDTIVGTMKNSGGNWTIDTVDQTSGISSNINLQYAQSELYAFVTLEVYSIASCGDYPTGTVPFTQLAIQDQNGPVTASWTQYTDPGCNEAVTIVSATEVTIDF